MKHPPEKERLLADVLAEESEPEFRETLLGQTLGLVKRRRRFRQVRRAAAAFALVLGAALLGWRYVPRSHAPVSNELSNRHYTLVRTHAFAAIISSQALAPKEVVSTQPVTTVFSTREANVVVPEVTDGQLLDLIRPSVVALVRYSPGNAELVFVNSEEREIFLRN